MAVNLTFDELLRYTNDEREKWRRWVQAHPAAMDAAMHPDGRYATVGKLIDHVFLAERRFLQRLTEERVTEATGLTGNNAPPLFDYGASVRRELEQFAGAMDEGEALEPRSMDVRGQTVAWSPRKVLFALLVHEVRHWAQIALAVRLAGFEPPGDHDLFTSRALR